MEEDISESYESIADDMIEECTTENEDLSVLSQGNDSMLIELVEGYPYIYDNRNPDFKDAMKKEEAWNEIATAMDWPVSECQNRWLRLREKFARETRAMDAEINGGVPQKKRTSFAFYEKMGFLKSHVKRRRTYPKILSSSPQPLPLKRSNMLQVNMPTMFSVQSNSRPIPALVSSMPNTNLTSKPITNSAQPAVVQIHQPALVQIIKPTRVSTTDEASSKNSSDSTSTRVGGIVITQSTSESFLEEKPGPYLNGESAQKTTSADLLFGQFVAAELMKMPESQRKTMKQKILKILYE